MGRSYESGWERQGTLWPAGTFVGEPGSLVGNLRSESGTTHWRHDCIVAGMLHTGPVLRARSRTASGGRVQRVTASSPSIVGEADSMVADLGATRFSRCKTLVPRATTFKSRSECIVLRARRSTRLRAREKTALDHRRRSY